MSVLMWFVYSLRRLLYTVHDFYMFIIIYVTLGILEKYCQVSCHPRILLGNYGLSETVGVV